MSWDIFVMDLPAVSSVTDIPDDWKGQPLGSRDTIIATIREVLPHAAFSDPAWGQIEGATYSIEVNIGHADPVESFAMHVRGGQEAVALVSRPLERGGWRAIDSQTGEFFSTATAAQSFGAWRRYRDAVIGDDPPA